jgi:hypothetical protein
LQVLIFKAKYKVFGLSPLIIIGSFAIMKATTRKILVWLYSPDSDQERWVDVEDLRLLLGELKKSGFRSLISLLRSQQLVEVSLRGVEALQGLTPKVKGQTPKARLTTYGRDLLESQFPVFGKGLDTWEGEWSLIVFLTSPKSDLRFRYLRKFLLNERCAQLSRGVYLYPGEMPSEVSKLLLKLYVGSVVVIKTKDWAFGDEKSIVNKLFLLSDIRNAYSGISAEAGQLLRQKNRGKGSSDQYKKAVYLVFDRLMEMLSLDLGLLHFYYPEEKGGKFLLSRLQELF